MRLLLWLSIILSSASLTWGSLNWSVGSFIGDLNPGTAVFDVDGVTLLPAGSLIYLIYDSDGDGADLAADGFSPDGINDILVANPSSADGNFYIGDGYPGISTPNGGFSSTPPLENAYVNQFVDTNGSLDGEMGLFYVRVFNVPDPTAVNSFWYGDSIDSPGGVVDENSPIPGGVFKYTETSPISPEPQNWTAGVVTLDTKVPEPSTFLLILAGLLGLGWVRRRKRVS